VTVHGYSGKPLVDKLGIGPDHTVYVDGGPGHVAELLREAPFTVRLPREVDITLLFTTQRSRLERRLPVVLAHTRTAGMIWVCWPKKTSKVTTDVDENVVREVALPLGVVDVKVVAVDATWSGLKLVRRLRDR
jgi:hypothetical protein